MKSITTLENIPDSLDIQEMMDVKGGAEARAICIFSVAVKCNVVGSGTCTVAGSGTAYEIGTGDWSSDVCSSDLVLVRLLHRSQIQIQLHLQSPDVKALTM